MIHLFQLPKFSKTVLAPSYFWITKTPTNLIFLRITLNSCHIKRFPDYACQKEPWFIIKCHLIWSIFLKSSLVFSLFHSAWHEPSSMTHCAKFHTNRWTKLIQIVVVVYYLPTIQICLGLGIGLPFGASSSLLILQCMTSCMMIGFGVKVRSKKESNQIFRELRYVKDLHPHS